MKHVWITGASSGLGRAIALEYAQKGVKLALSGRNIKALAEVQKECQQQGAEAFTVPFDITRSYELNVAFQIVEEELRYIDVIVNNSGIGQRSLAYETPLEIDRKIMEVNFFSHITLTKKLLPLMVSRKKGKIIVISSVSGQIGYPLRSAYCAAKHALNGFYETLAFELKESNISVTIVCPGRLQNSFSENALTSTGNAYGIMDKSHQNGIPLIKAARKIVSAADAGKTLINIGHKEWLMTYIKRFSPSLFYWVVPKVEKIN